MSKNIFKVLTTTQQEENYLKAIYHITRKRKTGASTNAVADALQTKASSVTDMIKKLADKGWVNYVKYQGVSLTQDGTKIALTILRKHRLWEVFLVDKLNFGWDEVHEVAEQLEHIKSKKLIDQLDEFLDFPKHDPHGDPIPDSKGNIEHLNDTMLIDLKAHDSCLILGVKDSSTAFLQYLDQVGLNLGKVILVHSVEPYDHSMVISMNQQTPFTVSAQVAKNLYIKKQ